MSNLTRVDAFGPQLEAAELLYYSQRDSGHKKDKFYASSVMDCGRKQIAEILQADQQQASKTLNFNIKHRRQAAMGDIIHGLLQSWAVASGKVKMIPAFTLDESPLPQNSPELMPAIEVPVNRFTIKPGRLRTWRRHRMGGKCDGILTGEGAVDYIWEIKTIDTKYLTNPDYARYLMDKLVHYEMQTQWYMWAFDIEQALICLIDRDKFLERFTGAIDWPWGQVCREYHVAYDTVLMEGEFERVAQMALDLKGGKLPKGEKHRGPCTFCHELTCEFNPRRVEE